MTILLAIDDNKNNLLSLKSLLIEAIPDCNVITARSGSEGVKLAKKHKPDTIILDVIMPELDGFETCKILKTDELTKSIPVILLTALLTDTKSKIKGLEAGAEAFLSKPIDSSELIAQTRAMIRIKKAEEELQKKKTKLENEIQSQGKILEESNREYKNIIENIGEGIGKLDSKNKFTFINNKGAEIFGYPKDYLLNESLKKILSDDMYKVVLEKTSKVKPGNSSKFYIKTTTKLGAEKTLFVTAMPEFDNKGEYLGASGIFSDVTKAIRDEKLLKKQFDLASISSATNDIKVISQALLESALDSDDLDSGVIYMRDRLDLSYNRIFSIGLSNDFLASTSSLDFDALKENYNKKDVFYCAEDNLPIYNEIKVKEGLKAIGIIPISNDDKVISIIIVASHDVERISKETKKTVQFLVNQLNSAFKRIILEQENIANIAKYKSLVEGTKDAILTIRKGKITDCNQALCTMLGYKSKSVFIGKSPLNFTTNKIIAGINPIESGVEAIQETLKHGFYEFEWILENKKGEKLWVEARLSLVNTGKQRFISVILRDLTKHKEREAEIHKFKTITDKANYGCAMTDINGKLIYVNKAFADMHNYKSETLLNKNINIVQCEFSQDYFKNIDNKLLKKGYLESTEVWHKTSNNEEFPALLNGMLFKDDNNLPSYISYTIIDISKIKQYETDIKKALAQAKESDQVKASFLASISHELRTPLNAVIGFSQILNSNLQDEEIDLYSKLIYESGLHLKEIVDDIFYFTMVKSGQEKLNNSNIKPSLLVAAAHKIALEIRENSKKEDIKIKLLIPEKEEVIFSDENKILHVFKQLVRNAFKFTQKGEITIGFDYEKQKKAVTFFIKDTGIGIPSEKKDIIFEFFRQADEALSRQYEGTGMGLALTKKLIEMLDGHIWVDSELEKGSTFYFNIPLDHSKTK
ncbi:MAG: hypothetical protein C0598_09050 [Marinilabiliales bacterium]|nr:MAG: hypothetical protein C0598_09050 [Marinilabiliales bacterium]